LITIEQGDKIQGYENCAQRAGFSVACGDTYSNAWKRAKIGASDIVKRIHVSGVGKKGAHDYHRSSGRDSHNLKTV
jgi:hypothetical protein